MSYLRKKLQAIMACADFKGYLREVTGYPLTLADCMGSDLVSLSVTGNAVQDGTPSPDAPVEVQGCGDRTANLFDSSTLVPGRSISCGGAGSPWNYNTSSLKMSTEKIYIKPNTKYTLITYNNDVYWRDRIIEANADDICTVNHSQYTNDSSYDPGKNIRIYPFTTNADTDYMIVRFQRVDCTDITNADTYDLRCMLLEGSHTAETIPQYEPYGYKVPVKVGGINLFGISNRTELQSVSVSYPTMAKEFNNNIIVGLASAGYWDSTRIVSYSFDGNNFTLQSSAGYGLGFDFDVSEGETYTVSYTATITGSDYVAWYDAKGMYMSRTSIRGGLASVTVPDGAAKLVLCFVTRNNSTMTISNVMLVKGSPTEQPPYEPYHAPQTVNVYTDKPLYAVGDVGDTITLDFDAKTAVLIKNFDKLILTDDISFNGPTNIGDTGFYRYYFLIPAMKFGVGVEGLCNVLPEYHVWNEGDFEHVHFGKNNCAVYIILGNEYSNDSDIISYLRNQGETEPYFIYPLATPTTTDISALQDWDAMTSTWRGTVTISAGTVIQPSSMTAQYYASKKED